MRRSSSKRRRRTCGTWPRPSSVPWPLYAATIFVSAFLLFLVQPIMAKQILPWFGGSANVWTTCLVFFQTTLLLGYAYADLVVRRTSGANSVSNPRRVAGLELHRACRSCPALNGSRLGTESPSLLILALLAATIGLPYFLLSTTSPLVQAWSARSFQVRVLTGYSRCRTWHRCSRCSAIPSGSSPGSRHDSILRMVRWPT